MPAQRAQPVNRAGDEGIGDLVQPTLNHILDQARDHRIGDQLPFKALGHGGLDLDVVRDARVRAGGLKGRTAAIIALPGERTQRCLGRNRRYTLQRRHVEDLAALVVLNLYIAVERDAVDAGLGDAVEHAVLIPGIRGDQAQVGCHVVERMSEIAEVRRRPRQAGRDGEHALRGHRDVDHLIDPRVMRSAPRRPLAP